jgi:hypothetical protein
MLQTNVGEKTKNTHFMFSNFFVRKSCPLRDNVKNVVERCRPQTTIWRMLFACWIPKATNTHSKYVIVIAFPLQQWWHKRASMLRFTYIACIVVYEFFHLIGQDPENWTF